MMTINGIGVLMTLLHSKHFTHYIEALFLGAALSHIGPPLRHIVSIAISSTVLRMIVGVV